LLINIDSTRPICGCVSEVGSVRGVSADYASTCITDKIRKIRTKNSRTYC